MSDITFMIGAVIIIIVGLFFLLKNASASFLSWYGDSGFLKIEKTFTMNLFNYDDFINSILEFIFLSLFYTVGKFIFAGKEIEMVSMGLFICFMIGFLPTFHFYKKYLFYKLNGKLKYTFNPKDNTLNINDFVATKISNKDILVIKSFSISGKINFNFKIICLKGGQEFVISSDLPFCDYLYEFFGEDVPFENIEFSPFYLFKYLKILRKYH